MSTQHAASNSHTGKRVQPDNATMKTLILVLSISSIGVRVIGCDKNEQETVEQRFTRRLPNVVAQANAHADAFDFDRATSVLDDFDAEARDAGLRFTELNRRLTDEIARMYARKREHGQLVKQGYVAFEGEMIPSKQREDILAKRAEERMKAEQERAKREAEERRRQDEEVQRQARARWTRHAGSIEITVESASIALASYQCHSDSPYRGDEERVLIKVSIANLGDKKLVHYGGWGGDGLSIGSTPATLSDELGNSYFRITAPFGCETVGQLKSASLYPGDKISDLLVFQRPVDRDTNLILSLPLDTVDEEGVAEFHFVVK